MREVFHNNYKVCDELSPHYSGEYLSADGEGKLRYFSDHSSQYQSFRTVQILIYYQLR